MSPAPHGKTTVMPHPSSSETTSKRLNTARATMSQETIRHSPTVGSARTAKALYIVSGLPKKPVATISNPGAKMAQAHFGHENPRKVTTNNTTQADSSAPDAISAVFHPESGDGVGNTEPKACVKPSSMAIAKTP